MPLTHSRACGTRAWNGVRAVISHREMTEHHGRGLQDANRPQRAEIHTALRKHSYAQNWKLGGTLLLLIACGLLGGTSGDTPGRAMIIEVLSLAMLTLVLLHWEGPRPPWSAIGGILSILMLPLFQLIPLPPEVWKELPGREVARDIAMFVDPGMWRPLTLDAEITMKSWLSALVPIALFLAALQTDTSQRQILVFAIIALATFSLLLGLVQVATGWPWLYPYEIPTNALPNGLFANRNHQAALMYVGAAMTMVPLGAAPFPKAALQRVVSMGLLFLFAAGIFATQSRAGMTLFVIVMLLSGPILLKNRINRRIVVFALISLGAISYFLAQSGVVRGAVGRFASLSAEGRYDIWPEARFAAEAYFPAGAGLGTFVKSYQGVEQLSAVSPYYLNHAHNDYIEMVLELGALAFFVFAMFLSWYSIRTFHIFLHEPADHANLIARIALIAILALLLHSFVDYPIRTFTHLGLFGLLCGLIYRPIRSR
ncbi:MAG: O-antigen ligase domain-containing protein [Alphaproteobacteria bacterium]|nr:MAG: O-antigen ligase domain-containing protein [Alphaproteobacteria bacterium]